MDVNSFMLDVGERRDWDKEESWWLPSCPGGLHSLFAAAKSIKHLYFLFYLPPTESCYGANSLFNRRPIRSCPRSCQEINSQRSFSLFVKIHLVFTFFFSSSSFFLYNSLSLYSETSCFYFFTCTLFYVLSSKLSYLLLMYFLMKETNKSLFKFIFIHSYGKGEYSAVMKPSVFLTFKILIFLCSIHIWMTLVPARE